MSGVKKLAAAGAVVLGLRAAALAGAGAALEDLVLRLRSDGALITATVSLELGRDGGANPSPGGGGQALEAVVYAPPSPSDQTRGPLAQADENILETTIYKGLSINNATGYDVDIGELISAGPAQTLPRDSPQILIIHTHSSEAYSPDGLDQYVASDKDRTEDERCNVIRVGDELTQALESYGLRVVHDRGVYDYPSYTGSYSRSGAAVESYLAEYPDIAVVIDLHRDALGDGDVVYKTKAEVEGKVSSQVMLLVGTGENGLYHPNWRENLKLALYLQQAMVVTYPTLARPVAVKQERYNQHLTAGSMILEVGSAGNTLQEAITAVRLFADAAAPALLKLVESE